MHPIDELLNQDPEYWQLDLIDRLQATSKIEVSYPDSYEEANQTINRLKENQLCPIKEIGQYSLTQLNNFIIKTILWDTQFTK